MAKLGDVVGMPVHTEPERDGNLVLPYGKVGIEIETEGWKGDGVASLPKVWEYHQDGSLRNNGMEFTTRGNGIVGSNITKAVTEFCKWAQARKLDVGYPRAGIHVHLDVTDLDFEGRQLHNLVAMYLLIEHALYGYAGEWRRTCGFCDPLSESQLPLNQLRHALFAKDSTGKALTGRINKLGRYYGLNVRAIGKYGTVEFRQLETTYDAKRILDWINIIFQLKQFAMNWPQGRNVLAEVSRDGARAFAERMMGKCWKLIQPWFEEERLWAAVDAAIVMMEGDEDNAEEADWNTTAASNPALQKKAPKSKKTSKAELIEEMYAPVQPAAPQPQLRPEAWEQILREHRAQIAQLEVQEAARVAAQRNVARRVQPAFRWVMGPDGINRRQPR